MTIFVDTSALLAVADRADANPGFVFDDEPLESVLYGESGAGPTVAELFADTEPCVSAIVQAFAKGEVDEGLLAMARLFYAGIR